MNIVKIVSVAAISLAALSGVASANSLVPGSDYFTEAQADGQANSVVLNQTGGSGYGAVTESRSYGYPVGSAAAPTIVPGSRTAVHDNESASVNAVIRGDYNGGYTGSANGVRLIVPGSGSF